MAHARVVPREIGGSWEITALPPDTATDPASLAAERPRWIRCSGPIPVAAALQAAGELSLDHPRDLDAEDWWYRCRFALDAGVPPRLTFGGLATVADVWLNGHLVLHSENMFVAHTIEGADVLSTENELIMRFRALAPLLCAKRPRPRWRTRLVSHQSLRWFRTSLLGRMPGWCPAIPIVGPWRPIVLDPGRVRIERADVHARLDGDVGRVDIQLEVKGGGSNVTAVATMAGIDRPMTCVRQAKGRCRLNATIEVAQPQRWWPHTHGSPSSYDLHVRLQAGDAAETFDLGRVGFRTLTLDRGDDGKGFGVVVNGVAVFCRGVCWTPLDSLSPDCEPAAYRAALEGLRDAGVNMIRIPATMAYENDAFYDLCDELGILVWQDLMFASMDYPWADDRFAGEAELEIRQVLTRLQSRPSLAIVCGNSEVEQQAALLGLDAHRRSTADADARVAALAREITPGAIWLAGSPSGGTFPFQVDTGVSHYYGVGAYRRPFDDARRAGVRFAAECLAFSNVPDPSTVALVVPAAAACGHEPRWKARVPRDAGAPWDFEEVRDHYFEQLFGLSPRELRSRDPERYLAMSRIATAEAMLRTFSEWRRPASGCQGGLVWFARDGAAGAGWGIVDAIGRPKAAYWYLKRVFAPVALLFADEGLNGLWLHAVNDSNRRITSDLRLTPYRDGLPGTPGACSIEIPPHGHQSIHANALFDGFRDLTDAYRFGPPAHDLIAATLRDRTSGALLAEACYFPRALPVAEQDIGLAARVAPAGERFRLHLQTDRFAFAVAIDFPDFSPDDNYVNVEPGSGRVIELTARRRGLSPHGTVAALNGRAATIVAEPVHAR